MRTSIQSERTCVPPVAAERAPPDSRMTGADPPVIAASLTEATPSITSPSDGMRSPASTSTMSPTSRSVPETSSYCRLLSFRSRLACVSVRWRRSVSACALPRPSATASAKFANSSVNQSHRTIWNVKPIFWPPITRSRIRTMAVRIETISSTNITGFRICTRGSSLTKADRIAGRMIRASRRAVVGVALRSMVEVCMQ